MKEIKLSIPSEWSDITIQKYQRYVEIQEGKGTDQNKAIRVISLFCNVKKSIIRKMSYVDMIEIIGIIKKLIDTEPDKTKFRKQFTFGKMNMALYLI